MATVLLTCSDCREPRLNELLEDLLASRVFHCDFCKKLLGDSVWLTPNNKNICGVCYRSRRRDLPTCLENGVLSTILQKVPLLCENRSLGCEAVLKHSEYEQHMAKCPCHPETCLFTECEWNGPKDALMRHLGVCHKEHFQRNIEKEAQFFIACKEGEDTTSVLETLSGRFIARIRREKRKVQVMILRHDTYDGFKENFLLKYYDGFTKIVQYACTPIDSMTHFKSFDPDHLTELNLDADIPTFVTLVYSSTDTRTVVPGDILPFYECADCKRSIKTVIYECNNDHRTCQKCLESCGHRCNNSVYRRNSAWVRESRLLNSLAQHYLFPCIYQGLGCSFNSPFNSTHESICDYQSIKCPVLPECSFSDHHTKLDVHLAGFHKSVKVVKDGGYFVHNITNSTECIYFMRNNIFKISYSHKSDATGVSSMWTFEKIVQEKDMDFLAKAELLTTEPLTKSLILVEDAPKMIHVPNFLVASFISKKQTIKCRVNLMKKNKS